MSSTQEGGHRTGRQLIKLEHRRFSVWPGSGPNGWVNPLIQNPSQNVGRFPPLLLEWAAFPDAPKQRLWPSRGRTPRPREHRKPCLQRRHYKHRIPGTRLSGTKITGSSWAFGIRLPGTPGGDRGAKQVSEHHIRGPGRSRESSIVYM